ncbi:MAG: PAS domain S-box protein [Chthoniobacterales bacterium]
METRHRLESAQRALREGEVTFAALAKVAPVGIMRFDPKGRCNYVNDRWIAITGLTIERAIGDGWQTAIHPEDLPEVVKGWADLRLQEDIFRQEYRICSPDGDVRWVLAEGVPLRSYSGQLLGFIRAVTDVTVHHRMEAELSAVRADLERRVEQRTAELHAEIRERQKLETKVLEIRDAEQRRFSEDLHDGLGQYLTGILFRALALQRDLQGAKSAHAAEAAKIAELVNETIGQAHDLARGVHPVPVGPTGLIMALQDLIERLCDPNVANCTFVCDDAIRIHQPTIATHLFRIGQEAVTNALKYSKATRITVTLRRHDDAVGELVIEDDGIGFRKEMAGTGGNGLSIMKHRARLVNGSLELRTAPGAGTSIRCEFPLEEPEHHEQA